LALCSSGRWKDAAKHDTIKEGAKMDSQTIARIFGALYLLTFVTSIAALLLFQPVLDDPAGYVANGGSDNRIFFGALLELLLIITNIGTAVVIYPIVRRQNPVLAIGYVTARIVECTFILVGILAVLSIVTLSQQNAGGDESAIAYTLAALKDWTFILGPGFIVGWGNGLILGYLMYASGLMPRGLTWLGLIGGPLLAVSGIAVMFGGGHPHEWYQGIATIPEALWELALGIYPLVWGFRRVPIVEDYDRDRGSTVRATPPPSSRLGGSSRERICAGQRASSLRKVGGWNYPKRWCRATRTASTARNPAMTRAARGSAHHHPNASVISKAASVIPASAAAASVRTPSPRSARLGSAEATRSFLRPSHGRTTSDETARATPSSDSSACEASDNARAASKPM
jgi:hypothetical protein